MAVVDDLAPGMDSSPPSEDYGRQPPQDLAAEQSVLGGMLLSKDAIADVLNGYGPAIFIVRRIRTSTTPFWTCMGGENRLMR